MPTGGRILFPELRVLAQRAGVEAKPPTVTFKATPKQVEFIQALMSRQFNYLAMGGGIRGTKTITVLSAFVILCRMFPGSRWAIVRKDLPTLRRNVIPSMEKVRLWSGGFVGELNQSVWTYRCANGSEILLFPEQATQDPELERWKGLEVNGFALEEASELSEKSANKAIERAGSWIIQGAEVQPPPLVLFTFNPCANWPRKWFYEPWRAGTLRAPYYFLPATIADNPFVTEEYKASLKHLPPEEYKRFVEGEWNFVDDPNQLIKMEWIWDARNVEFVDGLARMGADVARYGDDWSTIYKIKGNQIRKRLQFHRFDTMTVATAILNEANDPVSPVKGQHVAIDVVGLGAGVVDYCRKRGLPVVEYTAGAKPIARPGSFFKFDNLRSQVWWEAREKLRLGQFSLFMTDRKGAEIQLDPRLIQDLTTIRYEITGDKVIEVESKDDLKKPDRLGRSPDDGDGFVTALFDFPSAPLRPKLPGTFIVSGY